MDCTRCVGSCCVHGSARVRYAVDKLVYFGFLGLLCQAPDNAGKLRPVFPRSPGGWMQLIGVAHAGTGLYLYRNALGEIARRRVVNSVPDFGDNATAFWFMVNGASFWLGGRLLRSAEMSDDLDAQRTAGSVLVAVGIVGSAAMPGVSGFWSLPVVGGAAVRRSRQRKAAKSG